MEGTLPVLTAEQCMERLRARRESSSHGCVPVWRALGKPYPQKQPKPLLQPLAPLGRRGALMMTTLAARSFTSTLGTGSHDVWFEGDGRKRRAAVPPLADPLRLLAIAFVLLISERSIRGGTTQVLCHVQVRPCSCLQCF
jgi:hypothetical protein